ncbi:MAG: TonB-dependent receptor plug domain-containing protein [Prolixibacteraceae bacterium]|nr:TonB-dependent receptor plug domain-containing protein [Prolixibacteraceae bacterium]
MIKNLFILLSILILSSITAYAQLNQINGQVTVFDSIPVVKAQILVKSTDSIYESDEQGLFKIHCSEKDKVIIKAEGFSNQRIKIKEDTEKLNIDLRLKANPKNREIALGYGHIKERDKFFAASSMHDNGNDFSMYSSMIELIEGKLSGVDTHGGKVVIRGIGSASGDNTPLIIVDGVRVAYEYFNTIPPAEVKSIDVIKDGTAAMYGSEGANGVIVIETKKKID